MKHRVKNQVPETRLTKAVDVPLTVEVPKNSGNPKGSRIDPN